MKHSVDDAWEYAFFQNNPDAGQAVNKAVSRKKRRKWRPLKIYLIISTIIIVGGIALALIGLTNDAIHSSISVTTVSGEKVQVEPGMAPVELPIFGMTDYDGIIGGLKTGAIIFGVWRVILIVFVFVLNSVRRKRAAKRYNP